MMIPYLMRGFRWCYAVLVHSSLTEPVRLAGTTRRELQRNGRAVCHQRGLAPEECTIITAVTEEILRELLTIYP